MSVRHGPVGAQQLGQRGAGRGGVPEDRAYAPEHFGECAPGQHFAQLGGERLQRLLRLFLVH